MLNWRQSTRNTKVELFSAVILQKTILDLMQYSLNKDLQHLKWQQLRSWISSPDCQVAMDKQQTHYRLRPKSKWKMLTNYWKFQNRSVQTFGFVYHDTNGQNHGPVWKTQLFLPSGIWTVIFWQDFCGKGNLRKSFENSKSVVALSLHFDTQIDHLQVPFCHSWTFVTRQMNRKDGRNRRRCGCSPVQTAIGRDTELHFNSSSSILHDDVAAHIARIRSYTRLALMQFNDKMATRRALDQRPRPLREFSFGDEVAVWRRGTGKGAPDLGAVRGNYCDHARERYQGRSWTTETQNSCKGDRSSCASGSSAYCRCLAWIRFGKELRRHHGTGLSIRWFKLCCWRHGA